MEQNDDIKLANSLVGFQNLDFGINRLPYNGQNAELWLIVAIYFLLPMIAFYVIGLYTSFTSRYPLMGFHSVSEIIFTFIIIQSR